MMAKDYRGLNEAARANIVQQAEEAQAAMAVKHIALNAEQLEVLQDIIDRQRPPEGLLVPVHEPKIFGVPVHLDPQVPPGEFRFHGANPAAEQPLYGHDDLADAAMYMIDEHDRDRFVHEFVPREYGAQIILPDRVVRRIAGDNAALELRIAAMLGAQVPVDNGAGGVMGWEQEAIRRQFREDAKAINFMVAYGGGAEALKSADGEYIRFIDIDSTYKHGICACGGNVLYAPRMNVHWCTNDECEYADLDDVCTDKLHKCDHSAYDVKVRGCKDCGVTHEWIELYSPQTIEAHSITGYAGIPVNLAATTAAMANTRTAIAEIGKGMAEAMNRLFEAQAAGVFGGKHADKIIIDEIAVPPNNVRWVHNEWRRIADKQRARLTRKGRVQRKH